MRRTLLTLALVLLPVLACAAGAASPPVAVAPVASPQTAGPRIAVVDVQHVVMASEDGIRAQVVLKKAFDKRQADLDAKQAELARERHDIEQKAMPKDVREKKMADWHRRMTELQSTFVEYNKDLQKQQNELTAPIVKRLVGIIERTAEREGFDLVLDKQAAPYARRSLDLTDRMIKACDEGG